MKKIASIFIIASTSIYFLGLDRIFFWWDTVTGHYNKLEKLIKIISYLTVLIFTAGAIFSPEWYRYFESEEFDNWIVKLPKKYESNINEHIYKSVS